MTKINSKKPKKKSNHIETISILIQPVCNIIKIKSTNELVDSPFNELN